MKYFYLVFGMLSAAILLSSCGSNKELQERSPAQFGQAYFTSSAKSLELYIPVKAIQSNRISLDSVYFQGMRAELQIDSATNGLYTARFSTLKEDFIMSSDPAEEYSNKMPEMPVKTPFEIKNDEAIVVFKEHGKRKFYKIIGIKARSTE